MTVPSDFSDDELRWLATTETLGSKMPSEVEAKLVKSGVVNRTDLGPKITGLGKIVLLEAQNIGRLR